ncbi:30 kDa heat shock protein [Aspergillus cristatus]|uniref:30 kDa heat shock protein n=1 Tax=Aspergillus cristatus TaxID=573508 RepID=A0A1E3B1D1_ASPCR|nr:30 kDa heat shock protein [Aspergillus cristatus]
MSLFHISSPGDFAPLFSLLDNRDLHRTNRGQFSSLRSFSPRFDFREGDDAYYLDGELPGISQENIDIEFSDHQTLVIKGRSEREFHDSNDTPQDQEGQDETSDVAKTGEQSVTKSKKNNKHRYWVSERSVGEFHRAFSFPGRVDQNNVRASLKNGILSVVVPKDAVSGTKKITIQ